MRYIHTVDRTCRALLAAVCLLLVCSCSPKPTTRPAETFAWASQPISFEPPPPSWRREGENSGGMLGVRFILTGGVGEVISVTTIRFVAARDRREMIAKLLARSDSLARREFLDDLSLARFRSDEPLSEREAQAARAVDGYLDLALQDYLAENRSTFMKNDLRAALQAANEYEPTLAEVLWRIRLRPEQMQEPDRWRKGYERDTTIAGHPAFAGDDTLITPENRLLYREIFWVVNRCAFKVTYQGLKKNEPVFDRLLTSIQFPESTSVATR